MVCSPSGTTGFPLVPRGLAAPSAVLWLLASLLFKVLIGSLPAIAAMTDTDKSISQELTDHVALQGTILELDRNLRKGLAFTWLEVFVLLAAIAIPFTSIDRATTVLLMTGLAVAVAVSRLKGLTSYEQIRLIVRKQDEITARARKRTDKLYGLSILDPLSGLHNRRFGDARLAEEIARAERTGDPLAVILFDLDYFKELNDRFGHAVGDMAIRAFSRQLRKAIRACDVPVRMGGDEFLVILPECPTDKVEAILSRIGTPGAEFGGKKIPIPYSTGRAQYQFSDTSESLMARADGVLYAEKAARPGMPRDSHRSTPSLTPTRNINDGQAFRLAETNWRGPT
jgi:diguanylate cyclase (GGDEF)-like protein